MGVRGAKGHSETIFRIGLLSIKPDNIPVEIDSLPLRRIGEEYLL